jgi:hypothetical protein
MYDEIRADGASGIFLMPVDISATVYSQHESNESSDGMSL